MDVKSVKIYRELFVGRNLFGMMLRTKFPLGGGGENTRLEREGNDAIRIIPFCKGRVNARRFNQQRSYYDSRLGNVFIATRMPPPLSSSSCRWRDRKRGERLYFYVPRQMNPPWLWVGEILAGANSEPSLFPSLLPFLSLSLSYPNLTTPLTSI